MTRTGMHGQANLTRTAQRAIRAVLEPGKRAIDATAGNGHDTLFLARSIAPGGRVISLDIQPEAIAATTERLGAAGLVQSVDLQQVGHQHLSEVVPPDWVGTVSAIMFNLGYLPGSDKRIVTGRETTLPALASALPLLSHQGLLSIVVYPGHRGGDLEAAAVERWARSLSETWTVRRIISNGPTLLLVGRDPVITNVDRLV